jgi:hypothetical protein
MLGKTSIVKNKTLKELKLVTFVTTMLQFF